MQMRAWVACWALWGALELAGQNIGDKLAPGTRIEVQQGSAWVRGSIAWDEGPAAAQVKVRMELANNVTIVSRKSVRLAPRPAGINVGDRLEFYDSRDFTTGPATVKEVGSGTWAGYYLMLRDNASAVSAVYTKPENLWVLAGPGGAAAVGALDKAPQLGRYRCFAYGATGRPPIFLGDFTLQPGGVYEGKGTRGSYRFDAGASAITWDGGWMKDNGFAGKVESNATIRARSNVLCSHE